MVDCHNFAGWESLHFSRDCSNLSCSLDRDYLNLDETQRDNLDA